MTRTPITTEMMTAGKPETALPDPEVLAQMHAATAAPRPTETTAGTQPTTAAPPGDLPDLVALTQETRAARDEVETAARIAREVLRNVRPRLEEETARVAQVYRNEQARWPPTALKLLARESTYGAEVLTRFNIPDFKQPNQDVVRQRYPAVFDLFDSVLKHTEIPHAFDNPGAP
jgi:hypothetical protein